MIGEWIQTVSTGTENVKITFDTTRAAKAAYPKAHVASGLSNTSFDMPLRLFINRIFLTMCIRAGMDSAIADPNDRDLTGTGLAAEMLMGKDHYGRNDSRAYRSGLIGPPKP